MQKLDSHLFCSTPRLPSVNKFATFNPSRVSVAVIQKMNPYDYSISLRIRHPDIDPSKITDRLEITPKVQRKKGDPSCEESYWSAKLTGDVWRSSEEQSIENFLCHMIRDLGKHADYFDSLKKEGGRIEIFIGFGIERNSGVVLDSNIMRRLSQLGIDLAFDIYSEALKEKN